MTRAETQINCRPIDGATSSATIPKMVCAGVCQIARRILYSSATGIAFASRRSRVLSLLLACEGTRYRSLDERYTNTSGPSVVKCQQRRLDVCALVWSRLRAQMGWKIRELYCFPFFRFSSPFFFFFANVSFESTARGLVTLTPRHVPVS